MTQKLLDEIAYELERLARVAEPRGRERDLWDRGYVQGRWRGYMHAALIVRRALGEGIQGRSKKDE